MRVTSYWPIQTTKIFYRFLAITFAPHFEIGSANPAFSDSLPQSVQTLWSRRYGRSVCRPISVAGTGDKGLSIGEQVCVAGDRPLTTLISTPQICSQRFKVIKIMFCYYQI